MIYLSNIKFFYDAEEERIAKENCRVYNNKRVIYHVHLLHHTISLTLIDEQLIATYDIINHWHTMMIALLSLFNLHENVKVKYW